jgi:hypothetical protein
MVNVENPVSARPHTSAKLRLFSCDQPFIESACLQQSLPAHEHVAATEFSKSRAIHPVEIEDPVEK